MSALGKPLIPSRPQVQSDVTYQLLHQWHRKFEDYSALMGLHNLPPAAQHIYLHTCFAGGLAISSIHFGDTSELLHASSPNSRHITAALPQLAERSPMTPGTPLLHAGKW